MTRDEFMDKTRGEIDRILVSHKNSMMNIVAQAWAEGKKNAEVDQLKDLVNAFLESWVKPETLKEKAQEGMECPTGSWATIEAMKWAADYDSLPEACKYCSNHPKNGGSGICHCTMGTPKIT